MQKKEHCKVLVAPYMKIVDILYWKDLLAIIAEAVNTARSDGVVQILQNISVEPENENEEEQISSDEQLAVVTRAYTDLLSAFDGYGSLRLANVRPLPSNVFVMTVVSNPSPPNGEPC